MGHVLRTDGDVLKNVLIRKINKECLLTIINIWTSLKDIIEKDMRLVDESAMLDWTLDREKWKGL